MAFWRDVYDGPLLSSEKTTQNKHEEHSFMKETIKHKKQNIKKHVFSSVLTFNHVLKVINSY